MESFESVSCVQGEWLSDGLMAGLLEHMACFLLTGRPRSIHQARLLLNHIATHPAASRDLRESGRYLSEVLEDHLLIPCRVDACQTDPGRG